MKAFFNGCAAICLNLAVSRTRLFSLDRLVEQRTLDVLLEPVQKDGSGTYCADTNEFGAGKGSARLRKSQRARRYTTTCHNRPVLLLNRSKPLLSPGNRRAVGDAHSLLEIHRRLNVHTSGRALMRRRLIRVARLAELVLNYAEPGHRIALF